MYIYISMYGNPHKLNSQRFFSIPSLATPAVAPAARLHRRLSFLWGLGPGLPWGPRICNMWSIDGETWCYVADTDCEMLRVQNQQKMGGWPTKTLTNHLWDSWSGPHFFEQGPYDQLLRLMRQFDCGYPLFRSRWFHVGTPLGLVKSHKFVWDMHSMKDKQISLFPHSCVSYSVDCNH